MSRLTDDMVALMTKRVYDVAGCNPTVKVKFIQSPILHVHVCIIDRLCLLQVFLNGKHIPINSFKDYCMLYIAGAKKGTLGCKIVCSPLR